MVVMETTVWENESLTELGGKLKSAAKQNLEILREIERRKHERVICGYQISISSPLSTSSSLSIEAFPATEYVSARIDGWQYTGEKLEVPDDVFNVDLDYSCKNLADVARLNEQLLAVGNKYPDHLSDRPKNRIDLGIFIKNVKKLQMALNDVHRLTCDLPNPITQDMMLRAQLQDGLDGFKDLVQGQPGYKFNLTSRFSIGHVPEDVASFFDSVRNMDSSKSISSLSEASIPVFSDTEALDRELTLPGHSKAVLAIAAYKIGGMDRLASSSIDRTIKLWDVSSGELMATLKSHTKAVFVLSAFQYNKMPCLASGSFDRTIKLWNLGEQALMRTLVGHHESVYDLATFSHCDSSEMFLASGSRDCTIKIWEVSSGTIVNTLNEHAGHVCSLTLYNQDDTVRAASGSRDMTIKIWDLKSYEMLATLEGHELGVQALETFYYNGTLCLASGSNDKTIKLWSLETYALITTLLVGSAINSFARFENDGLPCLVSGDEDGDVKFWNLVEHKLMTTLQGDGYPIFATDVSRYVGDEGIVRLVCGKFNGSVELWKESSEF